MRDNEFKDALLKVAEELRETAKELRENPGPLSKRASERNSFEMGSVGRPNPASDPLMEFCLS